MICYQVFVELAGATSGCHYYAGKKYYMDTSSLKHHFQLLAYVLK